MNQKSKKQSERKLGRRMFLCGSLAIMSAAGCQNITRRGQSPDDSVSMLAETSARGTKYVGQYTGVWGLNYASIEGVGLAGNLDGTGSNPAPGWQVEHLIKELKAREDIVNPKSLIASENSSLVLVKGHLPPGIRKGENFDLEIRTLPKSETSSLFGGQLSRSRLRTMALLGRRVREGHVLGVAQGTILIDSLFESRQDQSNHVRGRVLGGGIALEDRPLGLTVRTDGHTFRQATSIAHAINQRFTTIENKGRVGVAKAKTDKLIELLVPRQYRLNVGRFVQIVQNTAFDESVSARVERLSQLERELADPALCATAAARLESLGKEAIPTLTRALRHPELEIRFHAAHALAYIGDSTGVEELQKTAEIEPAFRWHALTALASLEDESAGDALASLMHLESAETRYGAFRSLKARSPYDPIVRGEELGSEFSFHIISSKTEPMIHIARSKSPEIVLFGEGQTVSDDILYVESGLTIKGDGKGNVRIIRYLPRKGEQRKVCSTLLSDLIPSLCESGCSYSMLIRMLRDASQNDMLETRLVVDAVPKRRRKYLGDSESVETERSNRYISGPMPDLFRPEGQPEKSVPRDDIAMLTPKEPENKGPAQGVLSKMGNSLRRINNRR